MKDRLRDELNLLIDLSKEEKQEKHPEFKPADESRVRTFAGDALKRLYSSAPPVLKAPEDYKPGQVWQTKTYDDGFPSGPLGPKSFVLTYVYEKEGISIGGVPISEEWRFATPSDLVVEPGGGMPSTYDEWVMIELGMETFIPKEAISRYMSEVSDELFAKIQSILSWLDGEDVEREFMDAETTASGPPMEKWAFKDPVTGRAHNVLMGQQIVGQDDPRKKFKELEISALDYLVLPVVKKEQEAWEESREKQSIADINKEIRDIKTMLVGMSEQIRSISKDIEDIIIVNPRKDWINVEKTDSKELRKILH